MIQNLDLDPESGSGSESHPKLIGNVPSLVAIICENLVKIQKVEMDPFPDPESGSKFGSPHGILIQVIFKM